MHFFKRYKFVAVGLLLIIFLFAFAPPTHFSPSIVAIPRGTSAPEVARILGDAHIIAHPSVLRLALRISGASNTVQAGAYRFIAPENLFRVTYRLLTGDYGLPTVRITFPEGTTVRDDSTRVEDAFPLTSAAAFNKAGASYEGYLFPDTYFFPPGADADAIIETMRANFTSKITPLAGDISASGHTLSDIVIMASLIEKEVRTTTNRRIVAGILYNRLAKGMPLQVDAVFGYIYGRDTYSPSFSDLAVDSPYNTYTHRGLPPGPIDNPGLDAIKAALHPTKTNYLYYLTGTDGLMHYATTYAGHQANQKKYLR